MAKNKNLLLTEATTMRMMGLAGIGSLANPFLKEQHMGAGQSTPYEDHEKYPQEEGLELEEEMDELEETYMDEDSDLMEGGDEGYMDELEETYMDEDSGLMEDESLKEGETCESCGLKEGKHKSTCENKVNENITKSLKRLKKLLEQAEAPAPEEAPAEEPPPAAEPPPAMEGGDDAMEDKIKEFVKKLGELVQETLGVQVTVEEQEEEPEGGAEAPPPPEGGAEAAPPAPMAEAINRLVNKVARRVKARLMEAKKKDPKVAAKAKLMKEKQAAAKKKEEEAAKKKKEMMMKKKKAAMAKKKAK